jgi:F0F1-type ATP synthase membrane subunit b/b'
MTLYDDEGERAAEATPAGSAVPAHGSGSTPPGGTTLSYQHPESEGQLRRVADLIASARPMPLSASVMINREEVLELLEDAIERLPDELRQSRWLLKERDDFLAKTRRDADDILDAARARAERMVQRTEVVKAAELRARQTVDAADDEARRLRLECEDYCDQKLASFEIVLERTLKTVAAGRTKLQGNPLAGGAESQAEPAATDDDGQAFFDQDQ